ncbi:MAG: hypothetical protein AAGH74_14150 [Pseudomonadota bacterium]
MSEAQENQAKTRVVHFLLHVPKCAGTTVEDHFAAHLGKAFRIAPRWDHMLRDVIGNRYPGIELDGVKVVSGHSVSRSLAHHLPSTQIRESVLLRDPIGYFLSFYNYRWTRFGDGFGTEPPSFEIWYSRQRLNPISRFLLMRYFEQGVPVLYRLSSADRFAWLEERLAQFHFVASFRRADEMIAGISRELGLPESTKPRNVTPKKHLKTEDLPPKLRDRILRENAVDLALFERWAERGWSGKPSAPTPRLPRFDQGRYVLGDIATGLFKI